MSRLLQVFAFSARMRISFFVVRSTSRHCSESSSPRRQPLSSAPIIRRCSSGPATANKRRSSPASTSLPFLSMTSGRRRRWR